jgi:hypothetical protein
VSDPAPPQGGDIAVFIHALKARHHDHAPGIQIRPDVGPLDLADAGLVVGTVREDLDLGACVGAGGTADLVQGHGQQGDSDLFPGG